MSKTFAERRVVEIGRTVRLKYIRQAFYVYLPVRWLYYPIHKFSQLNQQNHCEYCLFLITFAFCPTAKIKTQHKPVAQLQQQHVRTWSADEFVWTDNRPPLSCLDKKWVDPCAGFLLKRSDAWSPLIIVTTDGGKCLNCLEEIRAERRDNVPLSDSSGHCISSDTAQQKWQSCQHIRKLLEARNCKITSAPLTVESARYHFFLRGFSRTVEFLTIGSGWVTHLRWGN